MINQNCRGIFYSMNDIYEVTQEGYEALQAELDLLKNDKRPGAVARLKLAREMGDLSENSEYSASREDLSMLDGRIAEIEEMIRRAKIVDHNGNNNIVELGETVMVEANGKKDSFQIVGELEADISANKLSNTSPIGKALLGKRKGESVEVTIPAGKVVYKIVKIQ